MAVDRLSSLSALVAALRAETTRKGERGARRTTARETQDASSASPSRHDRVVLREKLAELVRGLSPDDARAMSTAGSRVVRAVLLWEFGPQIREHPQWQPMLEELLALLETDPGLRRDFAGMVRDLQG